MTFKVGDQVRYKPGYGTYGYEDALDPDGRIPGVVTGQSARGFRVRLMLIKRNGLTLHRSVAAASLTKGVTP